MARMLGKSRAPAGTTPDSGFVRLAGLRSAFELVRDVLANDGEIIVLGIERLDQVWLKSSDAKLLSSLTLYTNLHALGLV
jgi:hypothetical protein